MIELNISRILTEVVHVVDSRGDVDGRVEHLLHAVLGAGGGVGLQAGAALVLILIHGIYLTNVRYPTSLIDWVHERVSGWLRQ